MGIKITASQPIHTTITAAPQPRRIGRDDRLKVDSDPEDALRALVATTPKKAKGRKSGGK